VAVAAGKQDKLRHAAYQRRERFTVGRRQIAILQRVDDIATLSSGDQESE
jgi:hypothetical protein